MVNYIFFWLFFVFFLLVVNFGNTNTFFNNYVGKNYIEEGDYDNASKYIVKKDDDISKYNYGILLYKAGKYEEALKEFQYLLATENKNILFNVYNVLGNIYYRLGEETRENSLEFYLNSVNNYEEALKIKYNELTEKNRDFVLSKIKELQTQDENKEENSSQGNENEQGESQENGEGQNQDGDDESSKENNGESENTSSEGKDSNTSSGGLDQSSQLSSQEREDVQDEISEVGNEQEETQVNYDLSQEQKQKLEKYSQMLQENQDSYSEGFNKVYRENSMDFFDDFFFDSFFDNSLFENNKEKDW